MKTTKKTNRNYINGANLERKIKAYFETQGFDAMRSAGSHGEFDIMADNGLTIWKVQSKKGMTTLEANSLAEQLAEDQKKKFKQINHPIVIFVAQGIKAGVPFGATRLIVPLDTAVQLSEKDHGSKKIDYLPASKEN